MIEPFCVVEPRGKIAVKNKGGIEMFPVIRLRPEFSGDDAGVVPNESFWKCYEELMA